jgi:hypothetical protein
VSRASPVVASAAALVVIKSLERITNERQAQLWSVIAGLISIGILLSFKVGSIVGLIDLVSWEIGCVNIRGQLGLEWCSNKAQTIEINASEEFVALNLIGTTSTKTIFSIANKARNQSAELIIE